MKEINLRDVLIIRPSPLDSSCGVRQLWQSSGTGGTMMRLSCPQPMASPLCIFRVPGAWQIFHLEPFS